MQTRWNFVYFAPEKPRLSEGEDETKRNERKKKDADSWGVNLVGDQYVDPSLLDRLLMELRDNGKLDYTLPADAFKFINCIKY